MKGDREGEGGPGLADGLALSSKEVDVAVLPFPADVTGVNNAISGGKAWGGLVEVAGATLRHEGVHEEVELDRTVVGWEGGGEEREVAVEDVYQRVAVGEPPAL